MVDLSLSIANGDLSYYLNDDTHRNIGDSPSRVPTNNPNSRPKKLFGNNVQLDNT